MQIRLKRLSLAVALLLAPSIPATHAQSTAFSYQGSLADNGNPANGLYDITFSLWDAVSGPSQVGATSTNTSVEVVDGVFTVTLDFGSGVFDGGDRWLEIGVATNGGGAPSLLSPREPINSMPYAIRALNSGSATAVSGSVAASQLTGTIASNSIAAGSITSVQLAEGAVGADELAAGAVTADKMFTTSGSFVSVSIMNPTPATAGCCGDEFGRRLAAVGTDRVLIGADGDDTGAEDAGVAYLYSATGALLTTLTNPSPALLDAFGVAVAALGSDRLIVGADLGDAGVIDAGAAHLFTTNGTLLTTFTNPAPEAGDLFGCAVSGVGADKVVIGAYSDDTFADDAGVAYLFGKDGDTLEVFFPPSPASGDGFGVAVAAAGTDKVVIGSLADAAYLFSTNGALLTTFTNPAPGGSDLFGVTVAAVGDDRVLIGAPYWDSPGLTNAGAAYLFGTDGSLLATYTSPSPAAGDYFGSAVSAKGTNTLVIGAQWENTGAPDAGAVYVFSADGTLRSTLINPTPASADAFGSAVAALSAEWVAVGTPLDDTGAENAGAAYIFGLNESFTPGLVAAGVVSGSIGTVELAAAAVTAEKVSALDAGSVTTGMLADERLSSNVALLDASQTFTGSNIFNAVAGSFSGDGSGLAALDASQLTSGILPDARLSTNVALVTDVDQLVDAAVATQISTNVAELDANQTFIGVNIFDNDVGIGTATPELKLDVRGGILSQVGNGNDDNLIVKKPGALSPSNARFVFSHRTTGDELWLYGYDGTTFKNLQGWNHADNTARLPANGDTLFVDMTAGRVGVGTSTPSTTLHVNGTITGDGSGLTALNASALGSGTVGSARISGSYNNSVSMGNTANVFSGRFQGNPTAPASAPSFTWVGDTDSGLFRSGANTVALATGGAERMRITSSGDVGIGTTLPEGDLHVRGGSSPGSLIVTPGVPDSDAQLLLAENTSASLGGILRYDGSANQVQILGWESDVATAPHVVVGRANGNVGLGTGANSVDARLHVQANNARVAKFDRYDTDGQLVAWARNDNVVGDVVVLAGNVTYNAFTGSHYAWCEQAPRPGALMSMTGDNRPLRAEGNSEVVYGVEPSGRANDPACLGAYMGTSAVDEQSVRLIAAVGNGEMWVVDTGPDIRPGDLLISSTIPGCARLDDPDEFAVGHVVARAAERVHWDTVQVGTDGIKRTKISVLYGPFTRGSRGTLAQTGARASDREIAALRRENRDLHQRLSAIEAMLGRTRLASASAATDQGGAR